ncbi:MAG: hypothetical protein AB7D00_14015, partial [Rhodospirillaceae bacterium]
MESSGTAFRWRFSALCALCCTAVAGAAATQALPPLGLALAGAAAAGVLGYLAGSAADARLRAAAADAPPPPVREEPAAPPPPPPRENTTQHLSEAVRAAIGAQEALTSVALLLLSVEEAQSAGQAMSASAEQLMASIAAITENSARAASQAEGAQHA